MKNYIQPVPVPVLIKREQLTTTDIVDEYVITTSVKTGVITSLSVSAKLLTLTKNRKVAINTASIFPLN